MKVPDILLFLLVASLVTYFSMVPATPPTKAEMKEAAIQILCSDCGNSREDAGYAESSRILKVAGPAIVPALEELLSDETLSPWFVGGAAATAAGHPFSETFRAALRLRRENPNFNSDYHTLLGMCYYFARHGDSSDLAWMEVAVSRLDAFGREHADPLIEQLRDRLSRQSAGPESNQNHNQVPSSK